MTTGGGYRNEDAEFNLVNGPASYGYTADGPVQYVIVANDNGVLGYLWASDSSGSAGFLERRSAGLDGVNAGGFWYVKLREPRAANLPPSQALVQLSAEPGGPRTGRVVAGSNGTAPSLAVLKELASG